MHSFHSSIDGLNDDVIKKLVFPVERRRGEPVFSLSKWPPIGIQKSKRAW